MTIKRKKLSRDIIELSFYLSKSVPTKYSRRFLETFISDRFDLIWLLKQYSNLFSSTINFSKQDLKDQATEMINNSSEITIYIEVYYFDSINYLESNTDYAFRWPFKVGLSSFHEFNPEFDLKILKSHLEFKAAESFKKLNTIYDHFLSDPNFKLDKIRVVLHYHPHES